jgi:hypothetical protein
MARAGVVCEGELGIGYPFGSGESPDRAAYSKKGPW